MDYAAVEHARAEMWQSLKREDSETHEQFIERHAATMERLESTGKLVGRITDENNKPVETLVAQLEQTVRVATPMLDMRSVFDEGARAKVEQNSALVASHVLRVAAETGIELDYEG